jgi:hypothetical protein
MSLSKTSTLTGTALDWAVATASKLETVYDTAWGHTCWRLVHKGLPGMPIGQRSYSPSELWDQAGPIIEQEGITIAKNPQDPNWEAMLNASTGSMFGLNGDSWAEGPTPLIAAMRCYVASKLGDELEIPNELR